MEETQVWSLFAMQNVGISIYFVGMMFLVWVAFRVSKNISESDGNILTKIVGSVFALTVTFFGLLQQGFTEWTVESTAYQLRALESLSPSAQVFADTFYAGLPDGGQMGLSSNPLIWIFWLCLLAFMLLPLWRSNN